MPTTMRISKKMQQREESLVTNTYDLILDEACYEWRSAELEEDRVAGPSHKSSIWKDFSIDPRPEL